MISAWLSQSHHQELGRCLAVVGIGGAIFLQGCSRGVRIETVSPKPTIAAQMAEVKKIVYFESEPEHQQRLEAFYKKNPILNERKKIQFLLDQMTVSGRVFVRNGVKHEAVRAAEWLRWKVRNHQFFEDDSVITARNFIKRVASFSFKSGIPYQVILDDDQFYPLGKVLSDELDALEVYYKKKAMENVMDKTIDGIKEEEPVAMNESGQLPPEMPALIPSPVPEKNVNTKPDQENSLIIPPEEPSRRQPESLGEGNVPEKNSLVLPASRSKKILKEIDDFLKAPLPEIEDAAGAQDASKNPKK